MNDGSVYRERKVDGRLVCVGVYEPIRGLNQEVWEKVKKEVPPPPVCQGKEGDEGDEKEGEVDVLDLDV